MICMGIPLIYAPNPAAYVFSYLFLFFFIVGSYANLKSNSKVFMYI